MQYKWIFNLSTIVILMLFSCSKEQVGSCLKSTGIVIIEKRVVPMFDSINIRRKIELYLIQDTVCFLEVEAGEHLLPLIETRLSGKTLYIENSNRCNWIRSYSDPVRVYAHFVDLKHIFSTGTGRIISPDTLRMPQLTVEFKDASTDAYLLVANHKIEIIQHTGASDVVIQGKTDELAVYMASLAWGDYRKLNASNVYVETKSASDCYVSASESYAFKLRAAGNIYYTTDIPINILDHSGSGKIIRLF